MAERWHQFVTDAIEAVHEGYGFTFLRPCRVWFRLRDGRGVLYQPDAILLRKRGSGLKAVVIEAETNPTAKLVPGDVFLASMVGNSFAEMFPRKGLGFGRSVRKERKFTDPYDRRFNRIDRAMDPETHNLLTGDEVTTLDFVLFTEGEWNRDYLKPYIELFEQDGTGRSFDFWDCIPVGRRSRSEVERKIGGLLSRL